MLPKISIIIPTFNRADKLPRAIESALSQTTSCEVIVVDHGSSDNTQEVVKKYKNKVTYIRRERDLGPHFCWLEGVLHCEGDFIHLQFDDDWIEDRYIEDCMNVMDDETGFAFCVVRVEKEGDPDFKYIQFDDWLPETGIYPVSKVERNLVREIVSPGCCLYRRDVLIDSLYQGQLPFPTGKYHGVGPDKFAPLLSILRYPKIGFVKEPHAVFLAHEGSITIDAGTDNEKKTEIKRAYKDVVYYYKELKAIRFFRKILGVR